MANDDWNYLTSPYPDYPGAFSGAALLGGGSNPPALLGNPHMGVDVPPNQALGGDTAQPALGGQLVQQPGPVQRMFPRIADRQQRWAPGRGPRVPWYESDALTAVGATLLQGPGMDGRYDWSGVPRGMASDRRRQGERKTADSARKALAQSLGMTGRSMTGEQAELLAKHPAQAARYVGDAVFGGTRASGTSDVQNYKFYVDQERAAGRTPLPIMEWRRAWAGSGGGAGNTTGTERIAQALMEEQPELTYSQALQMAQRSPTTESDLMRRERMALDAARSDPQYGIRGGELIREWRDFYGLPEEVSDYGQPQQGGQPAPAETAPQQPKAKVSTTTEPIVRPAGVPEDAVYSRQQQLWYSAEGQFYDARGNPVEVNWPVQ